MEYKSGFVTILFGIVAVDCFTHAAGKYLLILVAGKQS